MQSEFSRENEEHIEYIIRDNGGGEHTITFEKSTGNISYHGQDSYPDDPDLRTDEEKIHVQQAADYARYKVYRKRGYNTLDRHCNPDRLVLATLLVQSLSTAAFEEHFGDLYRQLKSEYTDESAVVDVHEELQADDSFMLYAKELYVGFEENVLEQLVDATDEATIEAYLNDLAELSATAEAGTASLVERVDDLVDEHGLRANSDPSDWIEAVSGVHVQWRVGQDIHREENGSPTIDRDPDAVVEIIPYNPDSHARTFTVGNHVAFNRGEYDTSSAEGQHALAYELAHVR